MYQIQKTCLCCHNCALECPVGAIDYVGTCYAIDQEKCIGCGLCYSVCNVGAVVDTEAVPAPAHAPAALEADLVVIGCGGSGSVAAVRAAELTGKKVIVLEKAAKPGGSAWFAGFQLENGAPRGGPGGPGGGPGGPSGGPPKRDESFLKDLDPELVAAAKAAPAQLYDWMITLPGVKEACTAAEFNGRTVYSIPQGNVFYNLKNYDEAIGPGHGGSFLIRMMVQQFDRLGIRLLTETRATEIKTDADGAVCGVVAQDPGGTVEIACRAVICASGGFAHNDELLEKYWPWFFSGKAEDEPVHRFAAPTNTGDVVQLGQSAGAYVDFDNFFVNLFGPVHHPFSFVLFQYCLQPDSIKVNLDGKRFFNDSVFSEGAAHIGDQPGRIAWSILDSDTMEALGQRLARQNGGAFVDFHKELDMEIGLDVPCKRADTLEDLAEQCGIAVEPFLQTIERYNGFCETGVDEDFGRTGMRPIRQAPFYAIYGKMATDGAFGGVLINGKTEVYRADREGVIPGLYATGDNASGWAKNPGKPGDNRMMVTGEMSWASGSGFIAGTQAAAYINGQ